jgi:hypothetical protein
MTESDWERAREIEVTSDMMNAGANLLQELTHKLAATRSNQTIVKMIYEVMSEHRRALPNPGADGMVSVPSNPTNDMLTAGAEAMFVDVKFKHSAPIVRRGYKAMLAAAQPGAAEQPAKERE